jgi:hypothetical protein
LVRDVIAVVRVQALEPIQDDDSAVKKYGVDLCVQMCRDLLAAGTPGVHFYTLNLEKAVTQILEDLDLIAASRPSRALPWRSVRASLALRFRFTASSFVLFSLFFCRHAHSLPTPTGRRRRTCAPSSGPTDPDRTCLGTSSAPLHSTPIAELS